MLCDQLWWAIFTNFDSVVHLFYNTPLKRKQYREALYNALTNILELKSDSPTQNTSTRNNCEHIDYLVTINVDYISYIRYPTYTKALDSFSKWRRNLARIFIGYSELKIHDSETIGDDCVQVTKHKFN